MNKGLEFWNLGLLNECIVACFAAWTFLINKYNTQLHVDVKQQLNLNL